MHVGQELWFVPSDRRLMDNAYAVTVKKVGRKWAEISNHERIEIDTLIADGKGYLPSGRCWLSKQDWEAEQNRRAAWDELRRFVERQHGAPDHLTEIAIRQAIALIAEPLASDRREQD